MEFSRIIIKPVHTEKSYAQQNIEPKKHAFIVDLSATKSDIKLAFESIYGFAPTKVSTQIRKPAKIRTGTAKPGFTKKVKIAYVTLPAGMSISAEQQAEESKKVETKKTESTLKEVKKDSKKVEKKAEPKKATSNLKEVTKEAK
ncbi:MAG: 50S ribosomal protein L23 [Mycoplasmoidaceae bacterium]|nr:50S ribosomal protein L23 [Mycoplasmoidaceae bacterium]